MARNMNEKYVFVSPETFSFIFLTERWAEEDEGENLGLLMGMIALSPPLVAGNKNETNGSSSKV
jgi:hypothetical protein